MAGPGLLRFAVDHVFILRVGLRDRQNRHRSHISVQQRYSHRRVIRWLAHAGREARDRTAWGRGIGIDRSLLGAFTQTDCSSGRMTSSSFWSILSDRS